MFQPHFPSEICKIISSLENAGFSAYVVGGCVRDLLLGKVPHDWDICTSALPKQIKSTLGGWQIIETGIQHGSVTILFDGVPFEIMTYGIDGNYSDHRHPDSVAFTSDLKADLSRRDFTMNAIALHPDGTVIDPFGGTKDIEYRMIRCVGEPNVRFEEDPLRILRAMRFSANLGFHIDPATADSMIVNRKLLSRISPELISSELSGIVVGDHLSRLLKQFQDIMVQIIPELEPTIGFEQNNPYHCYPVYDHIIESVEAADRDLIVRLAMLYHDIAKPRCYTLDDAGIGHFYGHAALSAELAYKSMTALRFDNKTISTVCQLVQYHDYNLQPSTPGVRRLINKIGEEQFKRYLKVWKADVEAQSYIDYVQKIDIINNIGLIFKRIQESNMAFKIKDLHVNGNDIISIGITPGPEVGRLLSLILEKVMDGQLENNKECLIAFINSHIKKSRSQ